MNHKKSDIKQLLAILLRIGCCLLVSDCDVGHVEKTIEKMCFAYDMEEVEVFIITSSIVVSIKDRTGRHITMTKRIRRYATNPRNSNCRNGKNKV